MDKYDRDYCDECGSELRTVNREQICVKCRYDDPRQVRKGEDIRRREVRKLSRVARPL
jgi:Zn finger protein HypA/HybF involved in hydrogenase expression